MNFIVKLIRYTKSKLVPLYVRLIFYFYKRLSRDYAHEKFLLLKANFKIKKFYLDFFINKFRDYPYFYWERYKVAIQSGEKNWKLYSRWAPNYKGVGDLHYFYGNKYQKSSGKKYTDSGFEDWLIKKKILDKSHFTKIDGNETLKISSRYLLNYDFPGHLPKLRNVSRICSAFQ